MAPTRTLLGKKRDDEDDDPVYREAFDNMRRSFEDPDPAKANAAERRSYELRDGFDNDTRRRFREEETNYHRGRRTSKVTK